MTQPAPPSVLLVDPNANVVFDTSNELAGFGYQVFVARGVDQAISIGRRERLDLLLCHEPLDVADASTLLRFLRHNKHLRQLRLVIQRTCQIAGVRLKVIHGEPVYCLGRTASIESMHCILNQTLVMKPRERPYPVEKRTPYLRFNHRELARYAEVN